MVEGRDGPRRHNDMQLSRSYREEKGPWSCFPVRPGAFSLGRQPYDRGNEQVMNPSSMVLHPSSLQSHKTRS